MRFSAHTEGAGEDTDHGGEQLKSNKRVYADKVRQLRWICCLHHSGWRFGRGNSERCSTSS